MKYIIAAIITIFLSVFCICNAMAQFVSPFGANRAQDSSKTKGQIVAPVYATSDTNKVLGITVSGHFVWRTKSGNSTIDTSGFLKKTDTSRSGIVTTYFYVDSLYSSIGTHDSLVKYSDSNIVYATQYGLDTAKANLRATDALKINYTDTTLLLPTKAFLLLNYWKNGGNSFGANSSIGTNDNFAIDFKTNNTTRGRWLANGRLVVGSTTDFGFDLTVNGTFYARGISLFDNLVNSDFIRINTQTGDPYIELVNSGIASVRIGLINGFIMFGSAGLVNTYSIFAQNGVFDGPESIIGGTSAASIFMRGANGSSQSIRFQESGVNARGVFGYAAGSSTFKFWVGNTATSLGLGTLAYSVDNTGNVGIGTEIPLSKMDIDAANGYSQLRLRDSYTPSSSADANGNVGSIWWDADYIYVKTAAGTIKRATLNSF